MTPIENLLARLPAKKAGKGWSARCPAHDDRRASLSIAQGDDGRALVWCHAGCTVEAICAAVALKPADLFAAPSTPSTSTVSRPARANGEYRRHAGSKPAGKTFTTAAEAVAELERQYGRRANLWTYYGADMEPAGLVIRWDTPTGKTIRPVSKTPAGWIIGGMSEPRPLYGLPDLAAAGRVVICEGEKAADAARGLGLVATTSAGGSQAADKTDWRPLAGKEAWIMPDNDAPGRKYAETVAGILSRLTPPPTVRVIDLAEHAPTLPEGGDLADVVADERWCGMPLGDAAEPEAMRAEIETLAQAVEPWRPVDTDDLAYRPFPVEALPEPLRGYVAAGAKAIGCDPSYLALPLLTAIAAAIGNTRRIQLKRGWSAPPILWTAIVGESGTAKTPAFQLVMRPVRERQSRAFKVFEAQQQEYEAALEAWNEAKKGERGEKPEPPVCERFIVSDTTVEALAPILLENPRGLLLARDELAGWIGSFDRYVGKGKAGADSANWLSMHSGESMIVDRKTGNPRTIFVPQAAVSVCGGIQPAILQRALGLEHRESGLAARLLLTCPPRKAKRWTEADIDPGAEAELVRLFGRLYQLQPTVGDDDEPRPVVVGLTPDAKAAWKAYYNDHAQEQADLSGDMAAAWSKLEEYAARLALVVHFVRWAAGDPTLASADVVDAASMNAGITLAKWFKHEARRVYAMLDESDAEREQRRLVEWIERKGGSVTPRDVQMGCRWLREPGAADAALEQLAKAGWGNWEPTPPGRRGQPTRRFAFALSTLSTRQHVNGIPNSRKGCQQYCDFPGEKPNTVDVDAVDAPESQADSEWGEV
jgi:hypothetical protein